MRRIGYLSLRTGPDKLDGEFLAALRGLGYVEGRTIHIDYRWAAGSEKRAEALARELVALKVEVIVTSATPTVRAAMRATGTIPIVMSAADPVGAGLVASFSHPGGNVTGLSVLATDLGAKRLQLIRDLLPSATRVGVLVYAGQRAVAPPSSPNTRLVEQLEPPARQMGIALTVTPFHGANDIADALAGMQRERVQAVLVQSSPVTFENRSRIAELTVRHRLPAMYETEAFVASGGLISYGPSFVPIFRRAAVYVDKILRGANPAELPIEQPSTLELSVNLKAAKALGLTVPKALLSRADRVIE